MLQRITAQLRYPAKADGVAAENQVLPRAIARRSIAWL
jgi:hypothetical protein